MEAVEDTPLKGAEQKDYALRLIRSLVVELADDEDKEYLCLLPLIVEVYQLP